MTKIERKTHHVDASSQTLGRLATRVSDLLRGKHKPDFSPNVDNGDFVIIENIANLKVSGKKMEQKKYYRHTGYTGNMKVKTMKELYEQDPCEIFRKAVNNMLPSNRLRSHFMKRLQFK